MKRSAGVTVASICIIVASAGYIVYEISTPLRLGKEGFAFIVAGSVFMLLFGIWGIVTGIGLLRLHRWAWPCIVIFSAVVVVFTFPDLFHASRLIRATTGAPTISAGDFVLSQYFQVFVLGLIPFALGVWWLVFFLRRSVRLQFAPPAPAAGATFAPARSGAVDASAIVLFFGAALALLLAAMVPITAFMPVKTSPAAAGVPFSMQGMLIALGVFYSLIGAWGVVTGIGVLKRRAWGRILMILTSALGGAFAVLGSIGMLLASLIAPSSPQLPASVLRDTVIAEILFMLIPLGVCIWWLILFTRPRIAAEFASPSLAAAPLISSPLVSAETGAADSVPVQFNASVVSGGRPAPTQIPLSIRVIAVLEILLGAMAFLSLSFLWSGFAIMKPSLLIFGFLVHEPGIVAFYIVSGIVPIIVGAAILLRKRWGLDALIVFLLAEVANFVLFFISPARTRFNSEMVAQMNKWMPQIKMPDGSPAPPNFLLTHMMLFQGVGIGISTGLYIVLLYFLFTRRQAFRDACGRSNGGPKADFSAAAGRQGAN